MSASARHMFFLMTSLSNQTFLKACWFWCRAAPHSATLRIRYDALASRRLLKKVMRSCCRAHARGSGSRRAHAPSPPPPLTLSRWSKR